VLYAMGMGESSEPLVNIQISGIYMDVQDPQRWQLIFVPSIINPISIKLLLGIDGAYISCVDVNIIPLYPHCVPIRFRYIYKVQYAIIHISLD
jgi:hypothetical protein